MNGFGFANFRDEAYESGIYVRGYIPSQENVLNARSDGMSNNVPKTLEEDWVEAIQSGSFIRLKKEDSPFYFTICDLI